MYEKLPVTMVLQGHSELVQYLNRYLPMIDSNTTIYVLKDKAPHTPSAARVWVKNGHTPLFV